MNRRIDRKDQMKMNEIQYQRISAALVEHDAFVRDVEAEWGMDRLADLVPEDLAMRFYKQSQKFADAIDRNDGKEVQHQVQVMKRAYAALIEAAKKAGHKPLTGEHWATKLVDGKTLAITRDRYEVSKVARDNPGYVVYSIEEVANIISAREKKMTDRINEVKAAFPGAYISSITASDEPLNDEIPF
jgi:hypothetical protein